MAQDMFQLLIRFCHITSLITYSLILSKFMDQKSEITYNFLNYTGRIIEISSIYLLVFCISFSANYWCFLLIFSDYTFGAVAIYVHEFYILISHKRIYYISFGTFFILKYKFSESLCFKIHPPGNLSYKSTFKVHQGHSLQNFNDKWKQFKYVLVEGQLNYNSAILWEVVQPLNIRALSAIWRNAYDIKWKKATQNNG